MKLLEKLKAIPEVGEALAEEVQAELTKRNEEAKGSRISKKEVTDLVVDIMKTVGAEKPEEIKEIISGSSEEIKMLMDKVKDLEAKNEKTEGSAKKTELESKITEKLVSKGIKNNFEFIKNGLMAQVKEGESGLRVGEVGLDDYIQSEFIDSVESITNSKKKKEKLPDGVDSLYSEEELNNLPEGSYEKEPEKIKASLDALG